MTTAPRIIDEYDPFPVLGPNAAPGRLLVKVPEDEPDRVTVCAAGLVVDIIANEDGSVYVEAYAYDGRNRQAVTSDLYLDAYKTRRPHLRLTLADVPRDRQP